MPRHIQTVHKILMIIDQIEPGKCRGIGRMGSWSNFVLMNTVPFELEVVFVRYI
jgi:hypothetical protein